MLLTLVTNPKLTKHREPYDYESDHSFDHNCDHNPALVEAGPEGSSEYPERKKSHRMGPKRGCRTRIRTWTK